LRVYAFSSYCSLCTGSDYLPKLITIGGDNSISAGTIPAINEKYIRREDEHAFTSDLIVLWIDSFTDVKDFKISETYNLNEMPVASTLGLCGSHFTKHKLNLLSNQIIYFGFIHFRKRLNRFLLNVSLEISNVGLIFLLTCLSMLYH
jgi:arginase family enzyme